MLFVAETPLTVAVIVATPGATPVSTLVSTPVGDTVTTEGLLDVQTTGQPFSGGGPSAVTVTASAFVPPVTM